MLAGEGDGGWPEAAQLGMQGCRIHGLGTQLVVGAELGLVEIGEAEAMAQQLGKALRRETLRRQPDGMQRRPEGVAGVGIVGPRLERHGAGRGAAEHQVEARCQHVGQQMAIPA